MRSLKELLGLGRFGTGEPLVHVETHPDQETISVAVNRMDQAELSKMDTATITHCMECRDCGHTAHELRSQKQFLQRVA